MKMYPKTRRERRLLRKAKILLERAMGDEAYNERGKIEDVVADPDTNTAVRNQQGGAPDIEDEGIYRNEGSLRGQGGGAAGQKMAMLVVKKVIEGGDGLVLRNAPAGASGTPDICIPLWRPFEIKNNKPVYECADYFKTQTKALFSLKNDDELHEEITRCLKANRAVFGITDDLDPDRGRDASDGIGRWHENDFIRFGPFVGFAIEVKDAGGGSQATIDPGVGEKIWNSIQHEDGFIFMKNAGDGDKDVKFVTFHEQLDDRVKDGQGFTITRKVDSAEEWANALSEDVGPSTGRAEVAIKWDDAEGEASSYSGAGLDSVGPAVVTYYEILNSESQTPFIKRIVGDSDTAVAEWRRVGSHFDRHGHTALPIFASTEATGKVYPWLPNVTASKQTSYENKAARFYDKRALKLLESFFTDSSGNDWTKANLRNSIQHIMLIGPESAFVQDGTCDKLPQLSNNKIATIQEVLAGSVSKYKKGDGPYNYWLALAKSRKSERGTVGGVAVPKGKKTQRWEQNFAAALQAEHKKLVVGNGQISKKRGGPWGKTIFERNGALRSLARMNWVITAFEELYDGGRGDWWKRCVERAADETKYRLYNPGHGGPGILPEWFYQEGDGQTTDPEESAKDSAAANLKDVTDQQMEKGVLDDKPVEGKSDDMPVDETSPPNPNNPEEVEAEADLNDVSPEELGAENAAAQNKVDLDKSVDASTLYRNTNAAINSIMAEMGGEIGNIVSTLETEKCKQINEIIGNAIKRGFSQSKAKIMEFIALGSKECTEDEALDWGTKLIKICVILEVELPADFLNYMKSKEAKTESIRRVYMKDPLRKFLTERQYAILMEADKTAVQHLNLDMSVLKGVGENITDAMDKDLETTLKSGGEVTSHTDDNDAEGTELSPEEKEQALGKLQGGGTSSVGDESEIIDEARWLKLAGLLKG